LLGVELRLPVFGGGLIFESGENLEGVGGYGSGWCARVLRAEEPGGERKNKDGEDKGGA
jgi:hypothetical protein